MMKSTLTNLCMVQDGSRVLILDRKNPDWRGWTFPGGHVEQNESLTDAVIREVQEETGLTVSSPRLCGVKDWVNDDGSRYIVFLYRTDQFTGTLRSSPEGEVFWAELPSLPLDRLASDMDTLLQVFLRDELGEQFYSRENETWRMILQ